MQVLLLFPLALVLGACPAERTSDPSARDTGPLPGPDGGASDASPAAGPDAGQPDASSPDASAPTRDQAMAALRESVVSLSTGWRFFTDGYDVGIRDSWCSTTFDDLSWSVLEAGRTWEDQGYPGYDGKAWYRRWDIPADWAGSPVKLVASGVDDEYDVYVNGAEVWHHGAYPDRSVYNWQTLTRIDARLRFGESNLIALRVNDWGGGGGLVKDVAIRRALPLDRWRTLLPQPVLSQQDWIDLYWEAWRMAFEKVSFGNDRNHLSAEYMDEGFNEQIYQWDSCFIALFARHGPRLFPAGQTLDNFYGLQRPDGYIQRVYSETTGEEAGTPTPDEPMVNPPLFAWVEWELYRATGDAARLARVQPVLESYYAWLKANLRSTQSQGLYFQTSLGSGMDNTPRPNVGRSAWIDMSAQQALAAARLSDIASALGDQAKAASWRAEHDAVAGLIDSLLWSEADGTYYDLSLSGSPAGVKHIGAYWALLAEVPDATRAGRLVAHLSDPAEFHRPHLFPTLAASDPSYSAEGYYFHGGVWAPTEYMVVKGLRSHAFDDLALEAAESHLTNLAAVWASPPADDSRIAPEERDGDYRTLWECYAPESASPATRWDGTWYSRQDFVGWTGLGPIAMLLEDVLGFDVDAPSRTVRWTMRRTDRHGALRLDVGDTLVDLVAEARADPGAAAHVEYSAQRPVWLEVLRPQKAAARVQLPAGSGTVDVP